MLGGEYTFRNEAVHFVDERGELVTGCPRIGSRPTQTTDGYV